MNKEEIIRMAREAGLRSAVLLHIYGNREAALCDSEIEELRQIERFANLVAEAEREAIIKATIDQGFVGQAYTDEFAAAIRNRVK